MQTLNTIGDPTPFQFEEVEGNIRIVYGGNNTEALFPLATNLRLIEYFLLQTQPVLIGPGFSNPPQGSLGEWIKQNFKDNIAAYIAPILVERGNAIRVDQHSIRFT